MDTHTKLTAYESCLYIKYANNSVRCFQVDYTHDNIVNLYPYILIRVMNRYNM